MAILKIAKMGNPVLMKPAELVEDPASDEIAQLDGILYPMRMTDMSTLAFNSELGDRIFAVARDPAEFSQ